MPLTRISPKMIEGSSALEAEENNSVLLQNETNPYKIDQKFKEEVDPSVIENT